jgi:hypothetical protein
VSTVVEFIDTSVLVEILEVPGKSQNHEAVYTELQRKANLGYQFILPVATVVETGNHIAKLENGAIRRTWAQRFTELLLMTADGKAPWTLYRTNWSTELLRLVCGGASTGCDLVEHTACKMLSTGDLAIVAERDMYAAQTRGTGLTVRIWTLEACMQSWADIPAQRSGPSRDRTVRG